MEAAVGEVFGEARIGLPIFRQLTTKNSYIKNVYIHGCNVNLITSLTGLRTNGTYRDYGTESWLLQLTGVSDQNPDVKL
jgi:hypothetical protein